MILVGQEGALLAQRRISDDAAGLTLLLELLAEYADDADDPIPVAVETARNLPVAFLRGTGRKVFAVKPAGGVPLPPRVFGNQPHD